MAIVKNGQWIAIDSVETDNTLSGTGRPGEPLGLANHGKVLLKHGLKLNLKKLKLGLKYHYHHQMKKLKIKCMDGKMVHGLNLMQVLQLI